MIVRVANRKGIYHLYVNGKEVTLPNPGHAIVVQPETPIGFRLRKEILVQENKF